MVAGQQPGRPGSDDQANLGAPQADLTGLLEGGEVVLGQPGQAGDRQIVVTLVDREGDGPLDQPLDPGHEGPLLRNLTGHSEDLSPPPRRYGAPPRIQQGIEVAISTGPRPMNV